MRFIVADEQRALDLRIIEMALRERDSAYRLENLQFEPYEAADLGYGEEIYAEIEINRRGDDLFADEIDVLLDELDNWEFELEEDRTVQAALRQMIEGARITVAVRVLFGDNGLEDGIRLLEPLWRWMFDTYDGVLQVDYEGYYDGEGLLLALEEDA